MDLTNMEGVEGDYSIIDECCDSIEQDEFDWLNGPYSPDSDEVPSKIYAAAVIYVLRKRGYLTPEAIEQLKKEGM